MGMGDQEPFTLGEGGDGMTLRPRSTFNALKSDRNGNASA